MLSAPSKYHAQRVGGVGLDIMSLQCWIMFINCFSSLSSNLEIMESCHASSLYSLPQRK